MIFTAKTFDELITQELYEILQLRAEIFVVEQSCVYQDLDGLDQRSLHLMGWEDGRLQAYLRMFEYVPGVIKIGRVLTKTHGKGHGGQLLKEAMRLLRNGEFAAEEPICKVFVEAQCYASGYYAKEGFQICGEEFIEDGIPHIRMELEW